jgi:hypothetical protein
MTLSEADLQRRIFDLAKLRRWRIVHIRNVRVDGRWRVPYEGDGGLPDLILARDGRVLLAELKTDRGKPTADQIAWLTAAEDHAVLWRPRDWDSIVEELR